MLEIDGRQIRLVNSLLIFQSAARSEIGSYFHEERVTGSQVAIFAQAAGITPGINTSVKYPMDLKFWPELTGFQDS
jgi:hypothetical protein